MIKSVKFSESLEEVVFSVAAVAFRNLKRKVRTADLETTRPPAGMIPSFLRQSGGQAVGMSQLPLFKNVWNVFCVEESIKMKYSREHECHVFSGNPSLYSWLRTMSCITVHTLHSAHHTLHITISIPHFTLHTLHFTLNTFNLHSTLHTCHFTLHTLHLHFILHTLHSTLHTLHSTLHTLHPTPHSTLYTPHFQLHTPNFTLYTPHFPLHTLHLTLDTLHSTLHTLHSTL